MEDQSYTAQELYPQITQISDKVQKIYSAPSELRPQLVNVSEPMYLSQSA